MTTNDLFLLHSSEFEKNIKCFWQEFQTDNEFFDVTLACEDKMTKAHKLIVSACSPVLRSILSMSSHPNPFIYLKGVKYRDLEYLFNFMYQGEVNINQDDLDSFLDVADDLKIKGLSHNNETNYIQNVIQTNFLDMETAKTPKKRKGNKMEYSYKIDEEKNDELLKLGSPKCEESPKFTEVVKYIQEDHLPENLENVISDIEVPETKPILDDYYSEEIKGDYSLMERGSTQKVQGSLSALSEAYACESCKYSTKRKEHLKVHVASVHEGITYQCPECNKKATTKSSLNRHRKRAHVL